VWATLKHLSPHTQVVKSKKYVLWRMGNVKRSSPAVEKSLLGAWHLGEREEGGNQGSKQNLGVEERGKGTKVIFHRQRNQEGYL